MSERGVRPPGAGIALAALMLACACSAPRGPGATVAPAAAAEGQPAAAGIAPDFELKTLDGAPLRLADSSGKVRLLDFWATWCAPCREEIPMLNELHAEYAARGLEILAITDETAGVIREFVDRHGVHYTNLVDGGEVAERYGVLGLPTAFLVDSEGRIVDSFLGPKPRKALTAKIEEMLGVGSPS